MGTRKGTTPGTTSLAKLKEAFMGLDDSVKTALLESVTAPTPSVELADWQPPSVTVNPDVFEGTTSSSNGEEKRLAVVDLIDDNRPNARTNLRFFSCHGLDIVLAMMRSAIDDNSVFDALLDLRHSLATQVDAQRASEKGSKGKAKAKPSKAKHNKGGFTISRN